METSTLRVLVNLTEGMLADELEVEFRCIDILRVTDYGIEQ